MSREGRNVLNGGRISSSSIYLTVISAILTGILQPRQPWKFDNVVHSPHVCRVVFILQIARLKWVLNNKSIYNTKYHNLFWEKRRTKRISWNVYLVSRLPKSQDLNTSMSVATWHNYSLQFIDQIWNITWWTALLPDGQTDKYSVNFQLTRLGLVPPPGPGPAPSLENILIEVARSYLLPQILHTSIHYECIFRILNSMKRP